jgi:N6-adenosine-specific RNA methylase IME4
MHQKALRHLAMKQYGALLADPPWTFATWSETRQTRAAKNHYDVMTLADIAQFPMAPLALPDSCLFLWVSSPMLPQALDVMRAWGFIYKGVVFCWVKLNKKSPGFHMGMGYWTRANVELCLLGTRGKPKRLAKDVRQLVVEKRREHSRKPEIVRASIERLVAGPYADLWSRQSRPGWDCFGNEAGKFDGQPMDLNKELESPKVNQLLLPGFYQEANPCTEDQVV